MNKKQLRKTHLKSREMLPCDEIVNKSKVIINQLVGTSLFKSSNVIMTYIDFKNEVITRDFIKYSLQKGKRIVVPITDTVSKKLILSELKDFQNDLEVSNYGILEPKQECIRKIDDKLLDLILVPGIVFDKRGYRIGYGGGYYDRFLAGLGNDIITVGLALDSQIVECLPNEEFDKKVQFIITEKDIIRSEKI